MPYHYNDGTDDQLLYERVESFAGGMDAFTRSTLLGPDVSQVLRNMVVLDNMEARTRPGADALNTSAVAAGALQGLFYYDTPTVERIVAAINKKIYGWNGTEWTEIDSDIALSDGTAQIAIAQGLDKLLISNVTGQMFIYDGSTGQITGQGTDADDPPTGATILCWHAGRMFASGFVGTTAGKESDCIYVSTLLEFGTEKWDATTRSFRVGAGEGDPIVALVSIQEVTLAVLKENSIWLCVTDPTDEPANYSANQLSEVVNYGVGCVGRRAWAMFGNDLLFMARDGVYSLRRMQAAEGQYELSAPLSQPLQPYIDRINWTYASKICATRYKQYVLFAVPMDSSTVNNAVLVYNGRLNRWIGVWDGATWLPEHWCVSRFGGVHRLCFMNADNILREWKDNESATDNDTYTDGGGGIESFVDGRGLLFGEPVNDKDAYHLEMRFSSGYANIRVTLMADNTENKSVDIEARRELPTLPLVLDFSLTSPGHIVLRRGFRGLPSFNECFLRIQSSDGWFSLRNYTLSAFLNTLQNE